VNLPYTENDYVFEENYKGILKNKSLSKENINYLNQRWNNRKLWGKCYMKDKFCIGMCTSSRIEAKHRVLKRFLNSSKGLVFLFRTLQDLEVMEIKNFQDEIIKLSDKEDKQYLQTKIMKHFQDDYSLYAQNKIKNELIESNNYKIEMSAPNKW